MEFTELIEDFASRHKVNGLVGIDNAASLDIDGIIITIVANGETLTISAEIGEPPPGKPGPKALSSARQTSCRCSFPPCSPGPSPFFGGDGLLRGAALVERLCFRDMPRDFALARAGGYLV